MVNQLKDTKPVRAGEELNIPVLEQFLREHIEGLPSEKLMVEQFGAGHSNLTYCLKIGDWEAVLRRPPLGPVAPKAHDMEREFGILSQINPVFPIAPKPYLFSDDLTLVGSPFFVMERKKGVVLDTSFPASLQPSAELGKTLSEKMVDQLVNLHNIDYTQTRLIEVSRPEGFLERQVHGWTSRYERAKTDDINGIEDLKQWLIKRMPHSLEPTIIHYDYKLNNAMFSQDLSEMIGLFDWEMSTVGDPLTDVAAAMSYWVQPDDSDELKTAFGAPPVTVLEGFYTRDEFIESYAKKSGRDVSTINYYLTFAYFKLAVIGQQIYYRYKKGQTDDPRFARLSVTVNSMIQQAISLSN
ncbi:phosphotransferase family protein [Bacillus massiliigorillae]|uniref:phosphotransferase family protein n=1 Tax=Bacillus massiliigorillae TaxID=1243664 RepID=UPI0003A4DB66|nr:phosphotransferase family protein [Bacillus massiliigorillae]